ncbi:hypothetical protein D3C81_2116230 [compost metagenome]
MGDAYQPGARPQQFMVSVEIEVSALIQRNDPNDGTGALGDQLPGHYIGVMLQGAEDYLVPGLQLA